MGQYSFKLPDVGEGTAEAEIVAWHVRVGDVVDEDAPLVDVMTDKATVEMTSPVAGRVVQISGEPGDMAAVGSIIAVFETDAGEAAASPPKPEIKAPPPPPPQVQSAAAPAEPKPRIKVPAGAMPAGTAPKPESAPPSQAVARAEPREPTVREMGQGLASPAVRARAQKLGIDLRQVRGTGEGGRISHDDLDAVLVPVAGARQGATALTQKNGIEPVKVIGLRRKIAEKMQDAKRRIPHFAYVEECDLTELED
jgi:2-oxoisovalerate dehydrogenase E2 component (dihydrolipoyl transacylase)